MSLGYEKETVLLEHTDDFGGTEPLGIHHLLTDADVRDSCEWRRCFALEVEFDGLFEIDDRFLASGAEAGHVHVQALRDVKLVLAIEAISDLFHSTNTTMRNQRGNGTK